VAISRRTILAAVSAAVAAQAQRPAYPNWKPKLGVLCSYSDANLEFVQAEGFTSMELRLDPDQLDDKRIASLARDTASTSMKLRYRIRGGRVWLGTNAFFFEEGTSKRFRDARYGEFRVDRGSGEAVLVGLRNEALERL
jgi:hypothetical protein